MYITFLIGNGFDLACGLDTGYSSFLEKYVEKNSDNEIISQFRNKIKLDVKNGNIITWADLELGFGKYTEYLQNDNDITVIYNNIMHEIKEYISEQEQLLDIPHLKEFIKDRFREDLIAFYKDLRDDDRRKFKETSEIVNSNDAIRYDFITFNYTGCLSKCLECISQNRVLETRDIGNCKLVTKLGIPKYIHGSIVDNTMLFGVDNESQLRFKGVIKPRVLRRVIKPLKNKELKFNIDRDSKAFISRSRVVCIYGMSMGETDLTWWKIIGEWLCRGARNQLLIIGHINDGQFQSATFYDELRDIETDIKERFMDLAGINPNLRENISDKIYVVCKTDLLKLNLVELSKTVPFYKKIETYVEEMSNKQQTN